MSCEHFFCTWGCQKEARANSQDYSSRESMPDDVSKTDQKAPAHNLVASKKIEKLPKISKIGTRDSVSNKGSTNLWRCKSITVLDSWTKFFNNPSKMFFITLKGHENLHTKCFVQQPWNLCSCFWTYFYVEDCAAASKKYQEKCATASETYQEKCATPSERY